MIYLSLFFSFFKLGLVAFGGGYVMVPLMEKEILANGWIPLREFADVVAISQMTPGPLAINAATYIGFRAAGLAGSAAATLGVFLPSFMLVLLVAGMLRRFKDHPLIAGLLATIRPATIGLLVSAVIIFAELSVFTGKLPLRLGAAGGQPLPGISWTGLAIFVVIAASSRFLKVNPLLCVVLAAALGLLLPG